MMSLGIMTRVIHRICTRQPLTISDLRLLNVAIDLEVHLTTSPITKFACCHNGKGWGLSLVFIYFDCLVSFLFNSRASCQIRKIAGAHASGMPGTISPSSQVSDPDMHHGTCVTHVPWCMPGSLTSSFLWNRRRGKTFPAFPAHAQPAILRIW